MRYQDAIDDQKAAAGVGGENSNKDPKVYFQLGVTERRIANSNMPDREGRTQ